jgi:hypothetical protein
MSLRRIALASVWILSIVLVGIVAHAQYAVTPVPPTVLSGSDFGFRVEGMKNNRPTGVLVVRVNGQWVEVDLGAKQVKPLSQQ